MSTFSFNDPSFDYTTQNPGIITNGLISYYEFNNPNCYIGHGTEVRDLFTPLGNTGQLNVSSAYAYNINSGSMIFTTEHITYQSIVCTMNGIDNFTSGAISICYWCRYDGGDGTQGIVVAGGSKIFEGHPQSNRIFQSGIQNNYNGGGIVLEWYSVNTDEYFSSPIGTVNGWHQWTTTVGGGNINWYQDGNLINTQVGIPELSSTDIPVMQIGTDAYGNDFSGSINCLQIYNRILTLTEVAYNYNAGKWRFSP